MKNHEKLLLRAVLLLITLGTIATAFGQATDTTTPAAAIDSASASVPRLVQFNGVAKDTTGKPLTGAVGISFLFYRDEQGGAPLWMEIQNVQADAKGHYSVQLGATKPDGLPVDAFTSGEARWLGVQIANQAEQPRVLLLSVPYALKAADAATIGGLPPTAFVRMNPDDAPAPAPATKSSAASSSGSAVNEGSQTPQAPQTLLGVKTASPGDTLGFVPLWTGTKSPTTQIGTSALFQSGSNVGLGTTSPAALFDVNGTGTFRDTLTLLPKGSDPVLSVITSEGTTFSIINTGDVSGHFAFFQGLNGSGPGILTVNNQTATSGKGLSANSEGTSGIGIEGSAGASSGKTTGILGLTNSPNGTGVLALGIGESVTGSGILGCCPVGLWGDTSSNAGGAAGLVGTADDARAIYLQNNSPSGVPTAFMFQGASGKFALVAGGATGACTVDTNGNLGCHGSKSAFVDVDNGRRQVALYAVEAPQNWFEDFGSGQLASGRASVALEATFSQTVNTTTDYHVFLTPEGDCRGLYVSNKSNSGFEVHELGGGHSSVAFSYRIVALRRGYENIRLEDQTAKLAKLQGNVPKPLATPAHWTPPARPKVPSMSSAVAPTANGGKVASALMNSASAK